jgi:hypothetical protein
MYVIKTTGHHWPMINNQYHGIHTYAGVEYGVERVSQWKIGLPHGPEIKFY